MRIVVDLIRCQSSELCAFAAPSVFQFPGEAALADDAPPDSSFPGVKGRNRR